MIKIKRNLYETSISITALICLMAICLLPIKIVEATEIQLNQTDTSLIQTIDLNVDAQNRLTKTQETIGVYIDIPPTKEVQETQNNSTTNDITVEVIKTEWIYPLTESEIRLVALIAELEDINAMQEIAETILNRILSDKFKENTVTDVIYAKGQFHTANLITDDMIPSDEAIQAVESVFRYGISTVGDSLFFAEKSIDKSKIAKDLYLIKTAGSTSFYTQK